MSFGVPMLHAESAFSRPAYHATIPQGRRYYRCSGGAAGSRRKGFLKKRSPNGPERNCQNDHRESASAMSAAAAMALGTLLPLIAVDMLSVGYSFLVGCNCDIDSIKEWYSCQNLMLYIMFHHFGVVTSFPREWARESDVVHKSGSSRNWRPNGIHGRSDVRSSRARE